MWIDDVRVVLVGTTHPGNIGASARAMKTMGLRDLRLAAAVAAADEPQAVAMAGGGTDVLGAATASRRVVDALADCRHVYGLTARGRRRGVPALTPREAAAEIATVRRQGRVALVFGREHAGLTNDEAALCHRLVHIPANPEYGSLNLAASVQVMAYELRMACLDDDALLATDAEEVPADAAHLESLYDYLADCLTASGYAREEECPRLMRRLRRLFGRARPESAEVNLLRGLLGALAERGDGGRSGP